MKCFICQPWVFTFRVMMTLVLLFVSVLAAGDAIATELTELPDSDPRLKESYEQYFSFEADGPERPSSLILEVREDWKRRGDAATPMLLEMLQANINTVIGLNLLEKVDACPFKSLNRSPFVSFARTVIDNKIDLLSAGYCVALSNLLVHHGDSSDVARLQKIRSAKPTTAAIMDAELGALANRLGLAQKPGVGNSQREIGLKSAEVIPAEKPALSLYGVASVAGKLGLVVVVFLVLFLVRFLFANTRFFRGK